MPCQVKLWSIAEMSPDVFAILPDVVWYLTQNGRDMWCRVPYGFFFSSAEAAAAFAPLMHSVYELQPTGVPAKELVSPEGLAVMRELNVTRIFLDPQIDPATGEVFGRILRIANEAN